MTKVIFLCFILSIQAMASGLNIARIIRQSPTTPSPEVRQSIDLIQNGKLAEAIELLQGAVKKNSEDGKVLHKLMTRRAGLGLSPLVLSLAEKITFAPATQDGRNVATIALLKYKIAEGRVEISMPDK